MSGIQDENLEEEFEVCKRGADAFAVLCLPSPLGRERVARVFLLIWFLFVLSPAPRLPTALRTAPHSPEQRIISGSERWKQSYSILIITHYFDVMRCESRGKGEQVEVHSLTRARTKDAEKQNGTNRRNFGFQFICRNIFRRTIARLVHGQTPRSALRTDTQRG